MSDVDLRGIVPKVIRWLEYQPDTSDEEDDEENVGNEGEDVNDEENDISNEETIDADEEEVIAKVEGKLFLNSLFEVIDHVKIS